MGFFKKEMLRTGTDKIGKATITKKTLLGRA